LGEKVDLKGKRTKGTDRQKTSTESLFGSGSSSLEIRMRGLKKWAKRW